MAEQEIIEGNKLIAEFMGLKPFQDSRYGTLWPDPLGSKTSQFDLKYHTSWDWLKPVIDEIFLYAIAYPEQVKPVREMKIVVGIIPAWERVVAFVKWVQ